MLSPDWEKIDCEAVVIGAGVIGLAIAYRLRFVKNVVLLEKYPRFGQETSSRNSEVIHSGIHYPVQSLKTRWCCEGREKLYDFCRKKGVGFRKTGKLVVALDDRESEFLDSLHFHCERISVPNVFLNENEAKAKEPLIRVKKALFFPESGILDSHSLMRVLETGFSENGGVLAYSHEVSGIFWESQGWAVHAKAGDSGVILNAKFVINAAGLGAARLSNGALGVSSYEHKFCQGRYLALSGRYAGKFRHLVYPVPQKDGLGIHVTMDLSGNVKLGPDVNWCEEGDTSLNYDCDWDSLKTPFLAAVTKYCPSITEIDLRPGLVGIRPKLFINGVVHNDFLVVNHNGFIHCLGMESPGLTSCLAVADEVAKQVGEGLS